MIGSKNHNGIVTNAMRIELSKNLANAFINHPDHPISCGNGLFKQGVTTKAAGTDPITLLAWVDPLKLAQMSWCVGQRIKAILRKSHVGWLVGIEPFPRRRHWMMRVRKGAHRQPRPILMMSRLDELNCSLGNEGRRVQRLIVRWSINLLPML